MICETISFNSYKENNTITFGTTTEKTENIINIKKNNYIKGKNDILKQRNNNKLIDIFNPVTKNRDGNENKNNP